MVAHQSCGSLHSEASEWDELEARSLVFTEMDGPQERLAIKRRNVGNTFRWKQIGVLIILAVCAFMIYVKEDILTLIMIDVEAEKEITFKDIMGDMKTRVFEAKMEFEKLIEEDYGIYKDDIFNKETIMNALHSSSHISLERLQRRIMIKILEVQLLNGKKDVEFNWVMGGHSAAAGHGNLYNQTYSYVLEQSVRPIFEALGITFYGKNYAAGGLKSAPEGALCMSSLYGLDLDILSWDFGMTDGSRDANLYNIWTQRAGVHPTRPIIISYGSIAAKSIHPTVEAAGMSAFEAVFVEEKKDETISTKLPDSDDENVKVDELPRGVKFYRCKGRTESGEPCGDNNVKFDTKKSCSRVGAQVNWHNGWKDHLLKGRVSAAFLIENVLEALNTLDGGSSNKNKAEREEQDEEENHDEERKEDDHNIIPPSLASLSKEYLHYLHALEANDKAMFLSSELPNVSHFDDDLKDHHGAFLRSKSICRYSYLPSYTRYNGLVTETRQEIKYIGGGRTTYQNEGIDHTEGHASPKPDNDSPPILFYNHKKDRDVCEYAEFDFKDYFSFRNEDKWVATVVPNDAENFAFSDGDDDTERVGLITICTRFFPFSRFPENYVSIEEMFSTDEATMIVNDVQVTNFTKIGTINSYCYVLRHGNDYVFPQSETHGLGRYNLRFRVPRRGGEMYLSSLIVI